MVTPFQIATTVGLAFVLHFPLKLAEDAVLGWVNEQIAHRFAVGAPTLEQVAFWSWQLGVPVFSAILILFFYHRWHSRNAAQVTQDSRVAVNSDAELIRAQADLAKQRRLQDKQDQVREGIRDVPAGPSASSQTDDLVPLSEAATLLLEESTEGHFVGDFVDEVEKKPSDILGWHAHWLAMHFPIWGIKPPSRRHRRLPISEANSLQLSVGNPNVGVLRSKPNRSYGALAITKRDLHEAIAKMIAMNKDFAPKEREQTRRHGGDVSVQGRKCFGGDRHSTRPRG